MEKTAQKAEWILVGSFLLLLVSLVVISQVNRTINYFEIASLPRHEKISVTLSGAFAKPGIYKVMPGVTLGSVIKKGRPSRFANLRELDLKGRIEDPIEVVLKELQEIVVLVDGEVSEQVELRLPPGSRVSQLKGIVDLTPASDKSVFKSRRMLRDGEKITVQKKRD